MPQEMETNQDLMLPPIPVNQLMPFDSLEMETDSAVAETELTPASDYSDSLLPPPFIPLTADEELIEELPLEMEALDSNAIYFLNLPWGADTTQISALLRKQNYERISTKSYQKVFGEDTALVLLDFQKNQLQTVKWQLISLNQLPDDTLSSRFKDLQSLLIERYGLPKTIREHHYDPDADGYTQAPPFLRQNLWQKEDTVLELQLRYDEPRLLLIYRTERFDEENKKTFKERIIRLF